MISDEEAYASTMILDSAMTTTKKSSLVADAQRRTIHCNDEFTRVTGYGIRQMRGRSCDILQGADTDPETVSEMRRTLDAGLIFRGRVINYRRDGSRFWNDLIICPLRDRSGEIVNFVSVQRDITRLVEQEVANRLSRLE